MRGFLAGGLYWLGGAREEELAHHAAVEEVIDGRRTAHDDEPEHDHDDFDSFVLELPAILRPEDLAEKVAAASEAAEVLRVKGFAEVTGKPMRLAAVQPNLGPPLNVDNTTWATRT